MELKGIIVGYTCSLMSVTRVMSVTMEKIETLNLKCSPSAKIITEIVK